MTRCRTRRARPENPALADARLAAADADEPPAPARVLVVEARPAAREASAGALAEAGFAVEQAHDGRAAWQRFRARTPDAVVAAFEMPGLSGLELLQRVRAVSTLPFLFQARPPEVTAAVAGMRAGADDVLALPDDLDALGARVTHLVERRDARRAARVIGARVLGRAPAMVFLRERLGAVAGLRVPLLVRGEPGSGRDHLVDALAAAAPEPARVVRIAAAEGAGPAPVSGAWVHLDEVADLSPADQDLWSARLRASERGEPDAPARIVASTAADLEALAREGAFAPELALRLSLFALDLPPLRERVEDVGLLARTLAARAAARLGRAPAVLGGSALRRLQRRSWPGNVRELADVVERLVAFAPDGVVTGTHVDAVLRERPASVVHLRRREERRQREELVALLDETGGNMAEVARRLDLSRGAVIYRAQKFGLVPRR